jgi:hypothetical protein
VQLTGDHPGHLLPSHEARAIGTVMRPPSSDTVGWRRRIRPVTRLRSKIGGDVAANATDRSNHERSLPGQLAAMAVCRVEIVDDGTEATCRLCRWGTAWDVICPTRERPCGAQ